MHHESQKFTSLRAVATPAALLALALTLLPGTSHAQEYRSSVVGTDFDFIRDIDPSTFRCLEYKDHGPREMPDKTGPSELIQQAFIFVAYFDDGTSIDIALAEDFETEPKARTEALRYVLRLGKLPSSLRRGVDRMVIHKGHEDATAFSDRGLIVVYSDNATKRISTHDLEETLFHESVHAAWDKTHAKSPEWRQAQASDGKFVTHYARKNPAREDLAESALFAYTLLHHPGRIPADAAAEITSAIPARIAYVERLLPPDAPVFYEVGPMYACDGSGKTFRVEAPQPQSKSKSKSKSKPKPRPKPLPERETEQDGRFPWSGETGKCSVKRTSAGGISDIVSNALVRGLGQDQAVVRPFLAKAKEEYSTAGELLQATMDEFGYDRATLFAQVHAYIHCNCSHD